MYHQHFVYKETQISHLSERDFRILSKAVFTPDCQCKKKSVKLLLLLLLHVCVQDELNWKWFSYRDKYTNLKFMRKAKNIGPEWIKRTLQQQGLKAELMYGRDL